MRASPTRRPSARVLAHAALGLAASAAFAPALAADLPRRDAVALPAPVPAPYPFVSEVRLGAFAHDPWSPEKGSVDINGEILFGKAFRFQDPFWNVFVPRVHVGGTGNFDGKTSHAYAGLTWTFDITSAIFIEGSFGGTVHNGKHGSDTVFYPDRNKMGCSWSFRESGSIGYRFTPNWSVMATVEHISNAGLCNQNRGLTNVGARIGYTF